jgi:hypothetical protein
MPETETPQAGIPCTKPKTLPALPVRVYDQWAISEVRIAGTNIGPRVTSGHFGYVRYRELPDGGREEDPDPEPVTAAVADLYAKAADPNWPEALALIQAARAFAQRLGREQGVL